MRVSTASHTFFSCSLSSTYPTMPTPSYLLLFSLLLVALSNLAICSHSFSFIKPYVDTNVFSFKTKYSVEWQAWKAAYKKVYTSEMEELQRHITWLSNKKFIEVHNQFNATFGYTLAMNEFGDLVS